MGWSWANGEMDDASVITGEVLCGASDGAGSHDALGWKGGGLAL